MKQQTTIYAPHKADDADKLAAVTSEMETLGSPIVRAYFDGDCWLAIEGSNRIAAAADLGLVINVAEVAYDAEINDHDFEDLPESTTVEAILDYLRGGYPVTVDVDEL